MAGKRTLISILSENRRQGCNIQVARLEQIMAPRSGPLLANGGRAVHRGIDKGTASLYREPVPQLVHVRMRNHLVLAPAWEIVWWYSMFDLVWTLENNLGPSVDALPPIYAPGS